METCDACGRGVDCDYDVYGGDEGETLCDGCAGKEDE